MNKLLSHGVALPKDKFLRPYVSFNNFLKFGEESNNLENVKGNDTGVALRERPGLAWFLDHDNFRVLPGRRNVI